MRFLDIGLARFAGAIVLAGAAVCTYACSSDPITSKDPKAGVGDDNPVNPPATGTPGTPAGTPGTAGGNPGGTAGTVIPAEVDPRTIDPKKAAGCQANATSGAGAHNCGPNHDQNCCALVEQAQPWSVQLMNDAAYTRSGAPFKMTKYPMTVAVAQQLINQGYGTKLRAPKVGDGKVFDAAGQPIPNTGWTDALTAVLPASPDDLYQNAGAPPGAIGASPSGFDLNYYDHPADSVPPVVMYALCIANWQQLGGGRLPTVGEYYYMMQKADGTIMPNTTDIDICLAPDGYGGSIGAPNCPPNIHTDPVGSFAAGFGPKGVYGIGGVLWSLLDRPNKADPHGLEPRSAPGSNVPYQAPEARESIRNLLAGLSAFLYTHHLEWDPAGEIAKGKDGRQNFYSKFFGGGCVAPPGASME